MSLRQPVYLEKIIERIGDFLHIYGPKIQVTDLSEGGSLPYRVVKSEFSCVQSCMKILAYLLVVPVIIALFVKLITHILLLHKYQLRREEDHRSIESHHEIPQDLHQPVVVTPITLVNEQEKKTGDKHTVISKDLLEVFRDNFPTAIGEMLVEQHLSFEEFQEFINNLHCIKPHLSLNSLSRSLKEKIEQFGMRRIAEFFSSRDTESLSLIQNKFKDVLLSFCPLIWLSEFCDVCAHQSHKFCLASPVPREAYRSRASLSSYWVSRLSFSDEPLTIFSPVFWVLGEAVTDDECKHLTYNASVAEWAKNKEVVSALFVRYCQYISRSRELRIRNLNITKELFSKYLLLLANHGFSLTALRFLRSLTLDQVLTLQDLTTGSNGNRLSSWMKSFGNFIYKYGLLYNVNRSFSQALQLLTWSELIRYGVNQSDQIFADYLSKISGRPIVISDPIVCEFERQVRKFNLDTGESITLQSRASGSPALPWTNWARSVHSKYS